MAPDALRAFMCQKAHILNAVELRLLRSLADTDCIEKATLNNRAYAYRQVADQGRLERGLATDNIGVFARLVIQADEKLGGNPIAQSVESVSQDAETPTPAQVAEVIHKELES